MARGNGKKGRRAVKRRNHGATQTGRNNDRAAVPPKTPSGEKGDGLMFVNDESDKARESVKAIPKAATVKPGDAGQKGAKIMNNNIQSQDRVFRMDAITLAKAACPELMYGEWEVILNALNGHRDAVMVSVVNHPGDAQITDALNNTRVDVSDAAHMGAGTHPDWPNKSPYSDIDGSASALIRKYPAWTDTQWLAVSLLAQAFWHYELQADELPLASE